MSVEIETGHEINIKRIKLNIVALPSDLNLPLVERLRSVMRYHLPENVIM